MPKINFSKVLTDLKGRKTKVMLDDEIVSSMGMLRQLESLKEATALKGVVTDIARANGALKLSNDDLELLQKYVEISLKQGGLSMASATAINEVIESVKGGV